MLCLHRGAQEIPFAQLRTIEPPPATATHFPLAHHRLVDHLRHSLTFYGHEITEEHHAVTDDGLRYFGLMTLKSTYGDYADSVALRNSNDKAFPIGVGFGGRVFVCDNLSLIADHVIRRKHTAKALRDIVGLMAELVEPLAAEREKQHRAFERFKAKILSVSELDHAVMDLYRADVLNIQRVPEVLQQWEKPAHDWGGETAWRLFNAVTYTLAGRVAENPSSTTKLHQVIDGICERVH